MERSLESDSQGQEAGSGGERAGWVLPLLCHPHPHALALQSLQAYLCLNTHLQDHA